jgi:hypothetical protein
VFFSLSVFLNSTNVSFYDFRMRESELIVISINCPFFSDIIQQSSGSNGFFFITIKAKLINRSGVNSQFGLFNSRQTIFRRGTPNLRRQITKLIRIFFHKGNKRQFNFNKAEKTSPSMQVMTKLAVNCYFSDIRSVTYIHG